MTRKLLLDWPVKKSTSMVSFKSQTRPEDSRCTPSYIPSTLKMSYFKIVICMYWNPLVFFVSFTFSHKLHSTMVARSNERNLLRDLFLLSAPPSLSCHCDKSQSIFGRAFSPQNSSVLQSFATVDHGTVPSPRRRYTTTSQSQRQRQHQQNNNYSSCLPPEEDYSTSRADWLYCNCSVSCI